MTFGITTNTLFICIFTNTKMKIRKYNMSTFGKQIYSMYRILIVVSIQMNLNESTNKIKWKWNNKITKLKQTCTLFNNNVSISIYLSLFNNRVCISMLCTSGKQKPNIFLLSCEMWYRLVIKTGLQTNSLSEYLQMQFTIVFYNLHTDAF